MSSQAIPVQMGRSFGSWRFAVIAALVAVALAIALIVANAGGSSPAGGGGSTTYDGPAANYVFCDRLCRR